MNRASERAKVSVRRMQSRLHEASLELPRWRAPGWLGSPADAADPSTAIFQRMRRSMTLLYAAVLVITLLLAGSVLYLAVDHRLMDPIYTGLDSSTQSTAEVWGDGVLQAGQTPCDAQGPEQRYALFACYSSNVALTGGSQLAVALPQFTDSALARRAIASSTGCATDQIVISNGAAIPPGYHVIARQACVARDASNAVVGVLVVGLPIEDYVHILHQLLILLLIVGAFTVAIAALGGFLLSARAMAPARLAYARQQRFIGDVSHELRTPLTLLRADAEMLLRGRDGLPHDDAELLDDIVDETARLASLTTSLLTLARLDSIGHLPERDLIDLAEVVIGVTRRTAAFADERGVAVRGAVSEGLLVNGVRDLIDQAALILVDNAIKYNKSGGHVEVRSERRGDRVALIVQDDGMGVAPEQLARLGERFFRPDKARSRQVGQDGGAGLGISIARSVAALHGGALEFASEPGQGLTATLTLPAARTRRDTPAPTASDDAPAANDVALR